MEPSAINPTVFIRRHGGGSFRAIDVKAEEAAGADTVRWKIGAATGDATVEPLGGDAFRFFVPDVRDEAEAEFAFVSGTAVRGRVSLRWRPAYHWRVYLIPIAHHDYGYTATIDQIRAKYRGYYRDVLRLCRETDEFPDDARFRYQAEQAWSVLEFLRDASAEERQEFIRRVREGRIEVPALLGNETTCLLGGEEIVRLLYPSAAIGRDCGVPVGGATITDIPGLAWSLASTLAGARVHHLFAGLPTYFDWYGFRVHPFWDEDAIMPEGRPHTFRWEGPDGASVLVHYQGGYGVWTPDTVGQVEAELPAMVEPLAARKYGFDAIRCAWNGGDNRPPKGSCSPLAREWNERWEWPRLIVGTNEKFFACLEGCGVTVPVLRGDLPDTDYVVGAVSTAAHLAANRWAREQLPAAEALNAIGASRFGLSYPADRIAAAWEDALMFDEHTWGMDTSYDLREDWNRASKGVHALRAASEAEVLLHTGAAALARKVAREPDETAVVAFNPLGHARTDVARMPFLRAPTLHGLRIAESLPFDPAGNELVDLATGKAVPAEVVEIAPDDPTPYAAGHHAFGRTVTPAFGREFIFVAPDVAAGGYRAFAIRDRKRGGEAAPGGQLAAGEGWIENAFFRVEANPATGRVIRLVERSTGRDLIDGNAENGFGDVLARTIETGELHRFAAEAAPKTSVGPVVARLRRKGTCRGLLRVVSEIALYRDVPRIDVAVRVLREAEPFLEHFVTFPFDAANPTFRVSSAGAFVDPWADTLPGANTNYLASDGAVEVSGGNGTVALVSLDAPIVEPGGPNATYVSQAHHGIRPAGFGAPFREKPENGHVAVLVATDNFKTNFPGVQSGDLLFRFAITAYPDGANATRSREFGSAAMVPFAAAMAKDAPEGALPATGSFVEIDTDGVALSALKRAEDGRGIIVRLREIDGTAGEVRVRFPGLEIVRACRTDVVERDREDISVRDGCVRVSIPANGLATVRCEVKPTPG